MALMRASWGVLILAAVVMGARPATPEPRPEAGTGRASPAAGSRKLYPVDEGPKDPSFLAFRQKLMGAARARDRRYIWSVVDPKIKFSFGMEAGIQQFKETWVKAPAGELEEVLLNVLRLGGTFGEGGRMFWAPYGHTLFPEDVFPEDAPYGVGTIVGKNVRLRSQPSATAPIVGVLSYDIVKVEKRHNSGWYRVSTATGEGGYVASDYLWKPVDYRACFEKKQGKWWMTVLIAGD
jgi:hypothetical protein